MKKVRSLPNLDLDLSLFHSSILLGVGDVPTKWTVRAGLV